MSEVKEVSFWGDRENLKTLVWYAKHFDSSARIVGEITPAYCMLPLATIQRMQQMMPAMKVALVVRNPILREWSSERRRWALSGRDPATVPVGELLSSVERRGLDGFGDHRRNIDRWRSVVGKRLLVIDFREISANPNQVLRDIGTHIGCGPLSLKVDSRINPNASHSMPLQVETVLMRRYAEVIAQMADYYPALAERWRNLQE